MREGSQGHGAPHGRTVKTGTSRAATENVTDKSLAGTNPKTPGEEEGASAVDNTEPKAVGSVPRDMGGAGATESVPGVGVSAFLNIVDDVIVFVFISKMNTNSAIRDDIIIIIIKCQFYAH